LSSLKGNRELSSDEFATIMMKLDANTPLVDVQLWNSFVSELGCDQALDPLQVVEDLAACSSEMAALLRVDMGLLRPCRGAEHAQSVLQGFEDDYRVLFQGDQESLKIMRLTTLLQDLGKGLSVKSTGDNQVRIVFTRLILENLLAVLEPDLLPDDAQRALSLLVDQNSIGRALLGNFEQTKIAGLRKRWPEQFAHRLDDCVVVAYLCDASAHSRFRSHVDIDSGVLRSSVSETDTQLTHLFHKEPGHPLTLCEPYRTSVLSLFPEARVLFTAARVLDVTEKRDLGSSLYEVTARASDTWSAVLKLPRKKKNKLERIENSIHRFAKRSKFPISAFVVEGRYGVVEVILTRDPSRRFQPSAPSVEECNRAAAKLARKHGWFLETGASNADFRVCVGLLEGYDHEAIYHHHIEALPVLLSGGDTVQWQVKLAYLISARKLPGSLFRWGKFFTWKEKVVVLEGKSTPESASVSDVLIHKIAALFNQDRIFLDDYRRNESIALKQVR